MTTPLDLIKNDDTRLFALLGAQVAGETPEEFVGRAVRDRVLRLTKPVITTPAITGPEGGDGATGDVRDQGQESPAAPEANVNGAATGGRAAVKPKPLARVQQPKPKATVVKAAKPGPPPRGGKKFPLPEGALTIDTPTRVVYDAILTLIENEPDDTGFTSGELAGAIQYFPPNGDPGYQGAALRHRLDNPAQVPPVPDTHPRKYSAGVLREYLAPVTDEEEAAAGQS